MLAGRVADIQVVDSVLRDTGAPASATGGAAGAPTAHSTLPGAVAERVERATGLHVAGKVLDLNSYSGAKLMGLRLGVPRAHYYDDLHPKLSLLVEVRKTFTSTAGCGCPALAPQHLPHPVPTSIPIAGRPR